MGVSPMSLKKKRCSRHFKPMDRRAGRRSSSLANLRGWGLERDQSQGDLLQSPTEVQVKGFQVAGDMKGRLNGRHVSDAGVESFLIAWIFGCARNPQLEQDSG